MHNNTVTYSIVIPVYMSGLWIDELVERIGAMMELEAQDSFELILVDDCSPDTITWPAIKRNAERHPWICGFNLLYNVGQFKATMCGLEHAEGQFIITMDDDLQHPPEELPKLIEAMRQNPNIDCIMGKYIKKKHSTLRNAGSWLMKTIMKSLYNKPPDIVTTSFRIMPSSFAKSLTLYKIAYPQLGPLIVTITQKLMNIPVEHEVRKHGSSGYSISYSIKETFQSVINASIIPLRLFSFIGFVTAWIAFLIGLYFLIRWAFGGIGVAGFTTLILSISFFSGMMLAGIGILGEYIGRIIQEITGLPRYRIKTKIDSKLKRQKVMFNDQ